MLELIDNFFRYGAIVSCLFTSAIVLRDAGGKLSARLAAFCCITTACYLASAIPGLGAALGAGMIPVLLICLFGPPAVWVFALSMFDDNFKLTRLHHIGIWGFYGLGLIQYITYMRAFGDFPLLSPTRIHYELGSLDSTLTTMISMVMLMQKLAMAVHLLVTAWNGRNDDLVHKRRRFREVFVIGVAFITIGIVVTENWLINFAPGIAYKLLIAQSGSIFLVGLYMLWHITSIDGEWLFGDYGPVEEPQPRRSEVEDRHDLETLDGLAARGVLLEAGLTIAKLAEMANMPEHRLRRLINQHLGYRNFADYLNFHRVEAAKARLAVVEDRHVPVLTVAMDLGYGSLGPFNRAFKERAGMTPTEFRKKALADC